MNSIVLAGCQPEPLSGYLKALGILRLVAEQSDPNARGNWSAEGFVLHSSLTKDDLCTYFLQKYSPTPIVSPWNGGSGFNPKDNTEALNVISSSNSPRLAAFRAVISEVMHIGPMEAPITKAEYLMRLRNELPDEALGWLDAATVLSSNGLRFPILLGTGGNDRRLDFSNNYMQRLVDALSLVPLKKSAIDRPAQWLAGALFAAQPQPLVDAAIGQFDPGSAGGSNSAPQGKGKSLVNPWDFILMLEGAIVFSGSAVRRRGEESANMSIPFAFLASPVGYGSAATENCRGEIWAPLWSEAATLPAVQSLFAEGRITWNGQDAKTGLDAVRGLATLQQDRRIEGFSRYVIAERFGLSNVALPVGRIASPMEQRFEVALTAPVDSWIRPLRDAPAASIAAGVRSVEASMFALASNTQANRAALCVDVLHTLAALERMVGRSRGAREKSRPIPIQRFRAEEWQVAIQPLLDESIEARIAWSLASGFERTQNEPRSLRETLLPINEMNEWIASSPVEGFTTRRLDEILSEVAQRREWKSTSRVTDNENSRKGARIAFEHGSEPHLSDAIDFSLGNFDESRLERYLSAFVILGFGKESGRRGQTPIHLNQLGVPALIAAVLVHAGPKAPALSSPPGLARKLSSKSGPGERAIAALRRSLQIAGYIAMLPSTLPTNRRWLAAALLLNPLTDSSAQYLLKRAAFALPSTDRPDSDMVESLDTEAVSAAAD